MSFYKLFIYIVLAKFYIVYMKKETSAGFIIFYQPGNSSTREFLVLQYPEGHVDYPKGHLNLGETEIEAAKRELLEETGIEKFNQIDEFHDTVKYKFKNWDGILVDKTVHFYLAEVKNKEVKLSHEHHNHHWLNYEQALKKITFDNAKQILINAQNLLTKINK